MTWYDMRMRVGPKNAGQVPNAYDRSNLIFNQFWSENIAVQIYFKNSFIFGLDSYFWRKKSKSQELIHENNSIRSVASNCLVSGNAHDPISCLILSVLICRLVKINFKNLWSQNRLNWGVTYSRLVLLGQGIPDSESWL
jgi:hypothetical protein